MKLLECTVEPEAEGMLLRNYLLGRLGVSHRLLIQLKAAENGILLNGVRVTVRAVLRAGDRLSLVLPAPAEQPHGAAEETPVCVCPPLLWLDSELAAVNKPGNMPTHPSRGHRGDTLADALCVRPDLCPDGIFRPVNRLDAQTSGIVLVARHTLAAARLGEAMKRGQIHKQYFAILDGVLPERRGEICLSIRRVAESIITRQACSADAPGAKAAVTRYRVLAVMPDRSRSLVAATPLTGRTHQLRVHFAALGAPILGDWLYGTPSPEIDRQALHAGVLSLPHPTTGETVTLCAPLPPDFRCLLAPFLMN